jgi:hypothetical protein
MGTKRRWGSRRRWGYAVWLVAGTVIAVPEYAAAIDKKHAWLQFTTISEMVGHLERHHAWVELLVVAVIVFIVFSTLRLSPRSQSGTDGPVADPEKAQRTAGGRLTLVPTEVTTPPKQFEAEEAPVWFAVAGVVSLSAIAVGTWAAVEWWQDKGHFQPSYVLYGSLALIWLVAPAVYAFLSGKDAPFPTLFRSVVNLEDWLKSQPWTLGKLSLGPVLGWLLIYVIVVGLAILLFHLTLYPYPDITKILNPGG